jgi:hypothetical protein
LPAREFAIVNDRSSATSSQSRIAASGAGCFRYRSRCAEAAIRGGFRVLWCRCRSAPSAHDFSAAVGFTYSWANKDTQYKNGISSHLDWAASQFLSPQMHVSVAGYLYYQLTGDSGAGATLGDFKSRVAGIGPQVGYFFPVGKDKWYVNLKGLAASFAAIVRAPVARNSTESSARRRARARRGSAARAAYCRRCVHLVGSLARHARAPITKDLLA